MPLIDSSVIPLRKGSALTTLHSRSTAEMLHTKQTQCRLSASYVSRYALSTSLPRAACVPRLSVGRRSLCPKASAAVDTSSSNGSNPAQVQTVPVAPPVPAPAPPPAPAPAPALLPPAAVYAAAAKGGALKAQLPLPKAFAMSLLAGVYVGFGALLSFTLLNSMPGLLASNPGLAKLIAAAVFPLGLALIIVCGAELFTGNTALMPVAVYEGQAKWGDVLPRWMVVYTGNLLGSLAMVAAVYGTGLMSTNTVLPALAVAKTSLPLSQALVRSVLCNWLVCLAVWMAVAASTLPGKLMGLWMPVTAFVTVGLEHSVANMFIIPMGMALGAPVSVATFLTANLIPVTLGNLFAGAVCTAGMYSLCYGRLGGAK